MKSTRTLFLAALLLCSIAVPAAAQVNDTYVVPAAANVAGGFGTQWMTQISIFNPQLDYDLRVTIVFVPTGGAQGLEATVRIPRNSSAYSDNILEDLFDTAGTGSLLLATFEEENPGVPNSILARSFLVTSNTYNNAPDGTFGQTIPGTWTGLQDYASEEISAVAHGVRNIARLGWRTNIGAVNLGDRSVTMRVSVYDVDGRTILKNAPFSIPPMGHIQDRLPIEVDRGSVEFFVDDPSRSAVVFPYASTIDQLSGDPTYQTPVLLANAQSVFGKAAIDPTAVGKRIDHEIARNVRRTTRNLGEGSLKVDANGARQITR